MRLKTAGGQRVSRNGRCLSTGRLEFRPGAGKNACNLPGDGFMSSQQELGDPTPTKEVMRMVQPPPSVATPADNSKTSRPPQKETARLVQFFGGQVVAALVREIVSRLMD